MANWNFEEIAKGLQDAIVQPDLWPRLLEDISDRIDGAGALMIRTSRRSQVAWCSPDQDDTRDAYMTGRWGDHDYRFGGVPRMVREGIVTDDQILSLDARRKLQFYNDFLLPRGCANFAGIGFQTADEFWCLSFQNGSTPFEPTALAQLKSLLRPLNDAAVLARRFDNGQAFGMLQGLESVDHAALLLDGRGQVVGCNAAAELLVGAMIDVLSKTFRARDPGSAVALDLIIAQALAIEPVPRLKPPTALVVHPDGRRLLVRAISLYSLSRILFSDARVLVLIKPDEEPDSLTSRFLAYGLTVAEQRLATEILAGRSIASAAQKLGVTYETARSRLKSMFHKTSTHRQGEFIALFGGLPRR